MKDDGIVLPEADVEAYDFPVSLRRSYHQAYIVSFMSSKNQGGSVSPVFSDLMSRMGCNGEIFINMWANEVFWILLLMKVTEETLFQGVFKYVARHGF